MGSPHSVRGGIGLSGHRDTVLDHFLPFIFYTPNKDRQQTRRNGHSVPAGKPGVCYCSQCLSIEIEDGSVGKIRRLILALLNNKREYDGGNPCDFRENKLAVMFLPCAQSSGLAVVQTPTGG